MANQVLEIQLPGNFEVFTDKVIERGWVGEIGKNRRDITGAISKMEAQTLAKIILKHNCQRSFETGVANGISTLAITQAIATNNGHHYGIDPCQFIEHQGVALTLLEEHNLLGQFTLCEGPTHLEAPKLMRKNETFDFVFIDGMHVFDYKVIDLFYADKLLQVGGFLVFHDLLLPSLKKLLKFIKVYCKYKIIITPELQPSLQRKAKYMVAAFIKRKPYWYEWPNNFCNLLVLQKTAESEHPWNYFENF
jgi:predicted O-methyltransferase YrrM